MPSNYENLDVWRLAHIFTLEIKINLLKDLPENEKFALKQQIWRASYSIPMNIVEGTGRKTNKDYAKFLYNALGSAKEVEYCLLLIKDLEYIDIGRYSVYLEKIKQIQKMINGLLKSVEQNIE